MMRPLTFAALALLLAAVGAAPGALRAQQLQATPSGIGELESVSPESLVPPGDPDLHGTRTRQVLQQQLGLPASTHVLGIGGPEADAIYQGYLEGIGSDPIGDTYRTQD